MVEGSNSYLTLGIVEVQTRPRTGGGGPVSVFDRTRNPCWGFMQPLGVLELEPARVGNSLGAARGIDKDRGGRASQPGPRGVTRSRDRGRWKEGFQTPRLCLSRRVIAHALSPSSLSPDRQPFGP